MTAVPLHSVPTGADLLTESSADGSDIEAVDIAADSLDTDLEPALAAAVGTSAVVVAASLLDFLR